MSHYEIETPDEWGFDDAVPTVKAEERSPLKWYRVEVRKKDHLRVFYYASSVVTLGWILNVFRTLSEYHADLSFSVEETEAKATYTGPERREIYAKLPAELERRKGLK